MPQELPVDVSIVVVTHNRSDLLEECLTRALSNSGDLQLQIIVVDNASTDNTSKMLKKQFPQVQVLVNQDNLGFAKANNQAFPYCRGRYVLLLNNDAFLFENTLPVLVQLMDRHLRIGVIGPRLLNADGTVQASCMHRPALLGGLRRYALARLGKQAKYVPDTDNEFVSVDAVTGACFLIRHQALDQVGLLDEAYFMYGEEADWCYRARQVGWQVAYCPVAEAVHLGGQTASAEPVRFYVERRYSRVRFFLKHRGLMAARMTDWMIRLSALARWGLATGSKRAYYSQILSLYNERIKVLFAAEAD